MPSPHDTYHGFPYDTGADTFMREFRTAVAPAQREDLMTKPALFFLNVPGEGLEYDRRVGRLVEALQKTIDDDGKLVPYALLDATADERLLTEQAGEGLIQGHPRGITPDRAPQFDTMRSVVRSIQERAQGGGQQQDAQGLRNAAYAARAKKGGLPALLWTIGGGASPPTDGVVGWLVNTMWLPLTRTLPRWWWSRRRTHQLIRPMRLPGRRGRRQWLGEQMNIDDNVFAVLEDVSQRNVARLAQPESAADAARPPDRPSPRQEAMAELEGLLLRALLEDLSHPPTGKVHAGRRHRRTRPVVLVRLPRGPEEHSTDEASARAALMRTERFLAAYCEVRRNAHAPGPLVIAIGRPSDALLRRIGERREIPLGQAGQMLHEPDGGTPVLVPISDESFGGPGLPLTRVRPKRFPVGWRTANALTAGTVLIAVSAVPLTTWPHSTSHSCVGGPAPVAESARSDQVVTDPAGWYDAAVAAIQRENSRAVALFRSGRTVRTVAAFVSNRPTSPIDTLFDGTIPELRGIALWQQKLNQDATADRKVVPLLVDVRNTGIAFANAEQEARNLVRQVRAWKPRPDHSDDYKQVIGVLGFAQSRNETKAALKVLDAAKILAIGTTATADDMLGESDYWPVTPLNSREAAIEADFAAHQPILSRHGDGGECEPARRALVIEDSGDLYSRSLASQFMSRFGGSKQEIDFTQTGTDTGSLPPGTPTYTDATELADRVCDEISAQPRTVVYWSSRAQDFTAFVSSFDTQGTCTGHDVTVLGGNELTNVAQTGVFSNKRWLRLYYSAHRLPIADARAGSATKDFVSDYDTFVKATTKGEDPWVDDGHSAVAYDAFHVLSRVADITYGSNPSARPSDMEAFFRASGMTFNGATGYVQYMPGVNQPPVDRTLVLLHQVGERPIAVVVCGAYQPGRTSAAQGKPCADAPR